MVSAVHDSYPQTMPTQLFFDLAVNAGEFVSIHFCEKDEFDAIGANLADKNIVALPINGSAIKSYEGLFRAFSVALKKPKGWYGDEEFAPNANAFLEYLDDVEDWVPANGHIAVISGAEHLWREQPRLAGFLVEQWQFATVRRGSKIHLVFVW